MTEMMFKSWLFLQEHPGTRKKIIRDGKGRKKNKNMENSATLQAMCYPIRREYYDAEPGIITVPKKTRYVKKKKRRKNKKKK